MQDKLYAQVILPRPIAGTFTYIIPEDLRDKVARGFRVVVPFGKRHYYTGIVAAVLPKAPEGAFQLKELTMCLDTEPIVRGMQLRFWEWMANYYLCTIGEVYKAAVPAGLKVESETRIELSPDADPEEIGRCTDRQLRIAELLSKGNMTVQELEKKLGESAGGDVARLIEQRIVSVSEKLVERYRAVQRAYVRPTIARGDNAALEAAFKAVKRSPKQEEALVALIALSEFHRAEAPGVDVPLEVLLERTGCTRTIVNELAKKGLCEIFKREVSRFSFEDTPTGKLPMLSPAQQQAFDKVMTEFKEHGVVLLHGVTGSGKTEIYIHLIDYVLRSGRQVLFLVPEIALTTQLTRRLQEVFGERVLIYHSKFSDNERVDLWRRMLTSHKPLVAVGARSAVFLPFDSLGLVIVDEEHDSSYKQYDPAPRYNGRDAAAMLAAMHGAKTLYGSATPSVETYYKALNGKFGLVSLTERYGDATLPDIEIVDMRSERSRKAVTGYFSHRLLRQAIETTNRGRQVILFHNRRGYSPLARCRMCAFTPKCDYCDVSLTYHRHSNRLQCHYCGAEYAVPEQCPQCHEPAIEIVGYGTERLEEEIAREFAGQRVLRMDLDTTRNKDGYSRIIDDFSQQKADILVGTQMVTKGLDFGAVELVGVLNADSLINFPDFRSAERAFNMIEQVAGRAGRRDGKGKVLIQTYNPAHPLLAFAAAHDYLAFYNHEIEERRAFDFPPFTRMINIYVKHREAAAARECATRYAEGLRAIFGARLTGPQEPPVARVQSMYIQKMMLKVETNASMAKVKALLRSEYEKLVASPLMTGFTVYYDVDPV